VLDVLQLAIDNVQTNDERAHVDVGRLCHTVRHFDGGRSQRTENGFGIDATDAMLLE
jgi:hypothetical protein